MYKTMNDTTYNCAVIGNPIAHSRSPEIHHAFAQQFAMTVHYERILATSEQFDSTVSEFFAGGGRGLNITVPFKERAFELAGAQASPRARLAGAVNTLWQQEGLLHGCNTDGPGLVYDLQRLQANPDGRRILLIGAGGAARGVVLPLLEAGATQLRIINRTAARAKALIEQVQQHLPTHAARLSAGTLTEVEGSWDIVINATSASLDAQGPAHAPIHYAPEALAYDMVYGAHPTPFMHTAQAQGAARCADGLGMLVGQAALSFEIWFSRRPALPPVLDQLRQQLRNDATH